MQSALLTPQLNAIAYHVLFLYSMRVLKLKRPALMFFYTVEINLTDNIYSTQIKGNFFKCQRPLANDDLILRSRVYEISLPDSNSFAFLII